VSLVSLAGIFVDSSGELSSWLVVVLGVVSLAGGILILVDPGGSILRLLTRQREWGRRRISRWAYSTPASWSKAMYGGFFVLLGASLLVGH
jgi:hypothetical protein